MTDDLTRLMSSADQALVVVTTVADGQRAGCVVGFHGQSGIDPARYALWLSKANHTYRVGLRSTIFAVHFLREVDLNLARRFATETGDEVDKFADVAWDPGPDGVPLLRDLPHRLVLRRSAILDDGGDHVCVTAAVIDASGDEAFTPLRSSAASEWEPGHDADERAIDPSG